MLKKLIHLTILLFSSSSLWASSADPLLPNSKFIQLPAGTFFMGSPTDERGHQHDEKRYQVELSQSFFIMSHEVTQRQWMNIMDENPSEFKEEFHCPDTFEKIKDKNTCPEHPVDTVSFEDVEKFLKKLNKLVKNKTYSLPTEAQWEYAARAGTATRYYFGDREDTLHLYAWYDFNSFDQTHQVGQLQPNAWGIHDMYGNVMEWTATWFTPYPSAPAKDPIGPDDGFLKCIRGGAFNLNPLDLRSATRTYLPIDFAINQFGFRLVKSNP